MAIAGIVKGSPLPVQHGEVPRFEYSHVLSPEHRQQGYTLHVEETPGQSYEAQLFHQGRGVGAVVGDLNGSTSITPHSEVDGEHQGKGLGRAMYEALYAHAYHSGVRFVRGGNHSQSASLVHESLARRHGLDYVPEWTGTDNPDDDEPAELGRYGYAIKRELQKSELDSPGVALVTAYNDQGELLLGRRKDNNKWTVPGGHLEPGEDPRAGAERELLEETGLKPVSLSFLREFETANGMMLYCFSAYVRGEPHSELDPDDEVDEWKFVDVSEGLPSRYFNNLHGPDPESGENLVTNLFDIEKAEDISTDLAKFDPRVYSLDDVAAATDNFGGDPAARDLITMHAGHDEPQFHLVDYPVADLHSLGVGSAAGPSKMDFLRSNHEAAAKPIVVGHDHAVLDGTHRTHLHREQGKQTIRAFKLAPAVQKSEGFVKAVLDPNAGYTFRHNPGYRLRDGYDHQIEALHSGKVIGRVHLRVGRTNMHAAGSGVYVEPEHRRRGVASAMYDYAERTLGRTMVPSRDRTNDGKALWAGNKGLGSSRQFGPYKYAKSEELSKAIKPTHLSSIAKATDPEAPNLVDHTPDLQAHPAANAAHVQAYREQVLNSPRMVGKKTRSSTGTSAGITRKSVFSAQVPGQEAASSFMVKPYHERVIKRVQAWMKHPVQGWAEMTNQALYHAAGIGDLHQKVHVDEHDMGPGHEREPALVVHLEPNHEDAGGHNLRFDSDKHGDSLRRIALMDFLANNNDRHGGNLLRNKVTGAPLAIDHSRNFQYTASRQALVGDQKRRNERAMLNVFAGGARREPVRPLDHSEDSFGPYVKNSAVETLEPLLGTQQEREYNRAVQAWRDAKDTAPDRLTWEKQQPERPEKPSHYDQQMDAMERYAPAFEWWGKVGDNVRKTFHDRLQQIKDPEVRDHMRRNFDSRADWLDERARFGLENYGSDWYHDPVQVYKPGELTDEEKNDPQVVEAYAQRARQRYEQKRAERARRRMGV